MKIKNYEIKVTVSKDLYQRIHQEAIAKNSKMAKLVRECILQYFSLREELASLGKDHTGKAIHTLIIFI